MYSFVGTLQWADTDSFKSAPCRGETGPHMVPWAHTSLLPKRYLDRFSRFAQLTRVLTAQHTCRHTDRNTQTTFTCNICSNRPHLCTACTRCGL